MYMKCTEHYTSLYGCFFIVFVFVSYGSSHILSVFVFFYIHAQSSRNLKCKLCSVRRKKTTEFNNEQKNRQWKERATDKTNKSFKRKKMNKWRNRMKTERWRNNNWLCQHKGKMLVDDKKKHFFSCCCPRTMRKLWIDKFLSFFFSLSRIHFKLFHMLSTPATTTNKNCMRHSSHFIFHSGVA